MTTGKDDIKLAMARVMTLLSERDTMTANELAAELSLSMQAVRGALRDLCARGVVARAGEPSKHTAMRYRVTTSKSNRAPIADSQPWRGVDWSASTMRPGCLDHERLPSRRGDQRIPYQGPMFFATSSKNRT